MFWEAIAAWTQPIRYALGIATMFCSFVALGLVLSPRRTLAVGKRIELAIGGLRGWLETPHRWERFFYRHHRFFGAVIVISAFYSVHGLMPGLLAPEILAVGDIAQWLVHAGITCLVVGNFVAAVLGLFIFRRPSTLKDVERRANMWIETSSRSPKKGAKVLDALVSEYPRTAGLVLTVGALYGSIMLLFLR